MDTKEKFDNLWKAQCLLKSVLVSQHLKDTILEGLIISFLRETDEDFSDWYDGDNYKEFLNNLNPKNEH